MRFKLDENLGDRGRTHLEAGGHDVSTIFEQGMTSATDEEVFRACCEEDRILITLDLDFANPFRFPPAESPGIAVIRLPKSPGEQDIGELLAVLIRGIESEEPLEARLWIVERGRIRVYEPDE